MSGEHNLDPTGHSLTLDKNLKFTFDAQPEEDAYVKPKKDDLDKHECGEVSWNFQFEGILSVDFKPANVISHLIRRTKIEKIIFDFVNEINNKVRNASVTYHIVDDWKKTCPSGKACSKTGDYSDSGILKYKSNDITVDRKGRITEGHTVGTFTIALTGSATIFFSAAGSGTYGCCK